MASRNGFSSIGEFVLSLNEDKYYKEESQTLFDESILKRSQEIEKYFNVTYDPALKIDTIYKFSVTKPDSYNPVDGFVTPKTTTFDTVTYSEVETSRPTALWRKMWKKAGITFRELEDPVKKEVINNNRLALLNDFYGNVLRVLFYGKPLQVNYGSFSEADAVSSIMDDPQAVTVKLSSEEDKKKAYKNFTFEQWRALFINFIDKAKESGVNFDELDSVIIPHNIYMLLNSTYATGQFMNKSYLDLFKSAFFSGVNFITISDSKLPPSARNKLFFYNRQSVEVVLGTPEFEGVLYDQKSDEVFSRLNVLYVGAIIKDYQNVVYLNIDTEGTGVAMDVLPVTSTNRPYTVKDASVDKLASDLGTAKVSTAKTVTKASDVEKQHELEELDQLAQEQSKPKAKK